MKPKLPVGYVLLLTLLVGLNLSLVCQGHDPPRPASPAAVIDERDLPGAVADGAYGNKPSKERAKAAGFRLRAPKRGKKQPGVGKVDLSGHMDNPG